MPIVFVHGVSVRKEHDYYQPSEKTRNEFFRQIAVRGVVQQPKLMCYTESVLGRLGSVVCLESREPAWRRPCGGIRKRDERTSQFGR